MNGARLSQELGKDKSGEFALSPPKHSRERSYSVDENKKNTMVEVKPMLTTGWFDNKEEFEAHRRLVKQKLNMSLGANGHYDSKSEKKRKIYKSYKDKGGSRGSVLFAGSSAYDVSSAGGLAELMSSIDDEGMAHLDEDEKRTLTQRYFSKMGKGSVRGSILGMTCAAIGSGVLTFPVVFKQIGWINGLLLLTMGAFGCWWSLYMLIQRARHHNCLNYSQVTRKAGGICLERTL